MKKTKVEYYRIQRPTHKEQIVFKADTTNIETLQEIRNRLEGAIKRSTKFILIPKNVGIELVQLM